MWLIVLPLACLLLAGLCFFLLIKAAETITTPLVGFPELILLSLILSGYLFARLSLILPATAADRQVDVKWAWKLSKNSGWRLIVIVGLLPWAFFLLTTILLRENATILEEIVFILLGFILLAVEVVALSLSYKHLTENKADDSQAVKQ